MNDKTRKCLKCGWCNIDNHFKGNSMCIVHNKTCKSQAKKCDQFIENEKLTKELKEIGEK